MNQTRSSARLAPYSIAVISVVAMTGIRLLMGPEFPFAALFLAVLFSAWQGGLGPGLLAAGLGVLAGHWIFLPPPGTQFIVQSAENLARLGLHGAVSLGIALLGGRMLKDRRLAEQHARDCETEREKLRVTLESIGEGVISTDTQGCVVSMNALASALTGWSEAEAKGRPVDEVFRIVNEQTRQPAANPVHKVLTEGRIVGLSHHAALIARDGTETPVDESAAPIRDSEGAILGVVMVFRGIAERRKAELSLQRSEQELSDFFENANVGLHWVGPDGIVLRVNRAELNMLGYTREEYVGRHIADFHEDPEAIQNILKRLAAGERLEAYTARMRCKDGSIRHVSINSSVRWEEGRFVHIRCFTLDVTDQKRAEEARAFLAAIVESSDDAIVARSLEGVVTSWNSGAERLFGYTGAEAVGRPITLIVPPDKLDEEREILARLRRGERIDNYDTVRVSRSGRRLDISLSVSPIRDDAGGIIGISQIACDITARRRAEQALLEADRRKDEFLATLSHELRNPLAPIRNSLEIMRRSVGDAERTEGARATMDRQVSHLERLVDDLLDTARIARDKLELRMRRVDLASVVHQAVETSRPLLESFRHDLTIDLPGESLHLDADPVRLAQVLSNLLNNACKYTPPNGRIWLAARREGGDVELSVRDAGSGIPPEAMPRLFEMFSQVDRTDGTLQSGLGIGLALVKRLVELHGGTVEARSEGLGRGSEFRIRLPLLPQAATEEPLPADELAAASASLARRILVVDDNRDAAISLAMLLNMVGHSTHVAHDGEAAIEAASAFRPDLALLDLGMPGLSGVEAARQIRQEPWGRNMVLVALTGWGQAEDRRKSAEAGFDRHLVKPVDHSVLMDLLASLPPSPPS